MEKDTPKEDPKPVSPKEEKPVESPQENPLDMSKVLEAAKEFMPQVAGMLKKKEKNPSTMCEFTIKGNDEFVLHCLGLILG